MGENERENVKNEGFQQQNFMALHHFFSSLQTSNQIKLFASIHIQIWLISVGNSNQIQIKKGLRIGDRVLLL